MENRKGTFTGLVESFFWVVIYVGLVPAIRSMIDTILPNVDQFTASFLYLLIPLLFIFIIRRKLKDGQLREQGLLQ